MSTVAASSSCSSSSMAPSRSATANLTINNKMELVSAGESGPPSRMFHPSNAPQSSHHSQQQQQQQPQSQSPYRFGAPDSRASYREQRGMGLNSGRSMTAHNHPSGSAASSSAAAGPWHPTNNHQAGAESGPKPGRSFSTGMASLSRSNGSLAGTANNSIHPAANTETDANGNSKTRSRTQVRLQLCPKIKKNYGPLECLVFFFFLFFSSPYQILCVFFSRLLLLLPYSFQNIFGRRVVLCESDLKREKKNMLACSKDKKYRGVGCDPPPFRNVSHQA